MESSLSIGSLVKTHLGESGIIVAGYKNGIYDWLVMVDRMSSPEPYRESELTPESN